MSLRPRLRLVVHKESNAVGKKQNVALWRRGGLVIIVGDASRVSKSFTFLADHVGKPLFSKKDIAVKKVEVLKFKNVK
jgi:hypothetical protein